MTRVNVETLDRGELARVRRLLENKEHAEQLERLIAAGSFVNKIQLLQLADQELDESIRPWKAWLAKHDIALDGSVQVDFTTGEITKEVPDDLDGQPDNTDDSNAAVQGEERDGGAA